VFFSAAVASPAPLIPFPQLLEETETLSISDNISTIFAFPDVYIIKKLIIIIKYKERLMYKNWGPFGGPLNWTEQSGSIRVVPVSSSVVAQRFLSCSPPKNKRNIRKKFIREIFFQTETLRPSTTVGDKCVF
jgi:hypothetical protein